MEELKIICPNCHSLLKIQNTLGISDKMLSCPICRFRAKVSVYQQANMKRHQPDDDDEPTQVNLDMMDRTIGSLFYQNVYIRESIPLGVRRKPVTRKYRSVKTGI